MERKIFDDRGFLSKEGKAFVNEGFTREVKRVLATAQSSSDAQIIGSILKTIVGDVAFDQAQKFNKVQEPPKSQVKTEDKPNIKLVKSDTWDKVIPFPGSKSSQELLSLLSGLSENPIVDTEK